MDEVFHWNIKITGNVQGVSFRADAQEMAWQLDLKGSVKNEADGSVYIEAEGMVEQLAGLKAWCEQGPETSEVKEVSVTQGEVMHFTEFKII